MNSLRRILSYVIGILLLFGASQLYFSLKQDVLTEMVVKRDTELLIQNIEKQGRLTSSMMDTYQQKLLNTMNLYKIDLKHRKLMMEPEYRLRTIDEVLEEQGKSYAGTNVYTYKEVNTENPVINQKEPSSLTMNHETNESVVAAFTPVGASPTHEHSKECIVGHVHEGSPKFTYYHRHSGCTVRPQVRYVRYYCPNCKKTTEYPFWSIDYGYFDGTDMNPDRYGYMCECSCGNRIGTYEKFISWAYDCGFDKDIDGDGFYDRDVTGYLEYPNYSRYPQFPSHNTHIFNNGCYQYHESIDIQSRYRYDTKKGEEEPFSYDTKTYNYSLAELGWIFEKYPEKLKTELCYVPRYYKFQVSCGSRAATVTYELIIPEDESEPYFKYVESWVPHPSSDYPYRGYYQWTERKQETEPIFRMYINSDHTEYLEYKFKERMSLYDIGGYIRSHNFQWMIHQAYTLYRANGTAEWPKLFVYANGVYPYIELYTSGKIDLCDRYGDNGWKFVCGQAGDGRCACNEKITNIVPTHANQSIYKDDFLITTLLATYMDGSQKVVIGSTDFNTSVCGENQTANLFYTGYNMQGKQETFQIGINANVIPKSKTCAKGHTYYLDGDGLDHGCPYCKAWLESLQIVNPASKYIEIMQGTSLETNGVKLLATYLDGHTEYVTTGYNHNLDSHYIGLQTVTIGYKGKKCTLQVKVLCKKKKCTICNKMYDLYPDGSDPGCPHCIAKIPVFTGNTLKYYEEVPNEDIKVALAQKGEYELSAGDDITITATSVNETFGTKLLRAFGSPLKTVIRTTVNGQIRDER